MTETVISEGEIGEAWWRVTRGFTKLYVWSAGRLGREDKPFGVELTRWKAERLAKEAAEKMAGGSRQ